MPDRITTALAHGATTVLPFKNRVEAGERLAWHLLRHAGDDAVVIGIARGGMIVAEPVARALDAPLDVLVVRKVCSPWNAELAIGAVAPGVALRNERIEEAMDISRRFISFGMDRATLEVNGRDQLYHGRRSPLQLTGKTVIIVDDGMKTGATAGVAVASIRRHHPGQVIVAVPVGSIDAVLRLESLADEVVCLDSPTPFCSVGEWYEAFEPVQDRQVLEALSRAWREVSLPPR